MPLSFYLEEEKNIKSGFGFSNGFMLTSPQGSRHKNREMKRGRNEVRTTATAGKAGLSKQ